LKAEDEAGNKTFKEINLASYYFQPNNRFDIMSRLASLIAPQKVFAAESGREAMRNNLGLAMGGFTNY
jgi:acetylornithine/succinyldiaminopimelate/putrescine aminotransferase